MDKIIKFLLKIYSLFIIKNQKYIIFESAREFFDNAYALFLYIKKNYPQYKLKYIITTKEMKETAKIRGVDKKEFLNVNNKLALYRYSLKAKLIVFNYTNYWKKFKLTPKTRIVYTAHGEFPLKNCDEYYEFLFGEQENKIDASFRTEYDKEFLVKRYPVFQNHNAVVLGMPRNDAMFHTKVDKAYFLKTLGIEEGKNKSIILSMTTYRNAHAPDLLFFKDEFPIFLNAQEVLELDELLGRNNQVFIVKLHHSQDGVIIQKEFKNIKFITNQSLADLNLGINELYSIADALISDFSSAYFSYLSLDRKLGFALGDKEEYSVERGYTLDNWEDLLPGDKMYSKEELFNFLDNISNKADPYKEKRKEVRLKYTGDYKDQNCKSYTDYYLESKKEQE